MADTDYDKLTARLTNQQMPLPEPQNVRTGEAAAAAGHAFLLREYGSEEAIARALRPGRPRLGTPPRGESPTVRGRISDDDFTAFKQLAERTGRSQSELVRESVHRLLVDEGMLPEP
jgi:hypothetical protein